LNTNVIPKGHYCSTYINEYKYECPYWSFREGHEEYEDGYCAYLGKGDYELNRERKYVMKRKDGTVIGEGTAFELGELKLSTLFDQVKMCNINMLDDEDII
jgi:hypothetical protein